MTERTIQHVARELAGQFYDFVRSKEDGDEKVQMQQRGRILLQIDPKAFAKTFPTQKDYITGRHHGVMKRDWATGRVWHEEGPVHQEVPGWMYWYDVARQRCVELLKSPDTHDNIKAAIMEALVEDREKQLRQEERGELPINIPQRKVFH